MNSDNSNKRGGGSIFRAIPAAIDKCEPVIEWLIRICGWSAILFVLAIFGFVFKEAFPALKWLDFTEFLTSEQWRPDSDSNPQYGILALLVGTGCITVLSTLMAVPLASVLPCTYPSFAPAKFEKRSRSLSNSWRRFRPLFGDLSASWFLAHSSLMLPAPLWA